MQEKLEKGLTTTSKCFETILFSFLLEAECITVATPQRWHRALVINTHLKQKKTDINVTLILGSYIAFTEKVHYKRKLAGSIGY